VLRVLLGQEALLVQLVLKDRQDLQVCKDLLERQVLQEPQVQQEQRERLVLPEKRVLLVQQVQSERPETLGLLELQALRVRQAQLVQSERQDLLDLLVKLAQLDQSVRLVLPERLATPVQQVPREPRELEFLYLDRTTLLKSY